MKTLKKIDTPKIVFGLLILIVFLIFVFQNMTMASISFIFITIKLPVIFLIFGLYILGVFTGWTVERSDVRKIIGQTKDKTTEAIDELGDQSFN